MLRTTRESPSERRLALHKLPRAVAQRALLVALLFMAGCMHWSGLTPDATVKRPAILRLHLHDGSVITVREAVVSEDSIVGAPWGGGVAGSRVAVARAHVDRIEIGEKDALRTTGLVLGIVVAAVGALVLLAVATYNDPS